MLEFLEIVFGGGGQPKFVANKIFEHGTRIAADGTMGFIGDDQIKIGW